MPAATRFITCAHNSLSTKRLALQTVFVPVLTFNVDLLQLSEDSDHVWAMITYYGGRCQSVLDKSVTHLVTTRSAGVSLLFSSPQPLYSLLPHSLLSPLTLPNPLSPQPSSLSSSLTPLPPQPSILPSPQPWSVTHPPQPWSVSHPPQPWSVTHPPQPWSVSHANHRLVKPMDTTELLVNSQHPFSHRKSEEFISSNSSLYQMVSKSYDSYRIYRTEYFNDR